MLYTPQTSQYYIEDTNSRSTPTNNGFGTALTVPTIATGYGAYTVIGATEDYPAFGFTLNVNGVYSSARSRKAVITLAYGASGSEVAIISDILVSGRGDASTNNFVVYFPIYVPANTNVSLKFAWDGASSTPAPAPYADIIFVTGSSGDPMGRTLYDCDTYGITSTTTPRGTDVTSDTSAGTYGSLTSLGTTTRDYKAIILIPGVEDNTSATAATYFLKLHPTSTNIITNYIGFQTTDEISTGPLPGMPTVVNIPSGTSLQVAMAQNNAGALTIDWAAYCFY